MNAEVRSQNAEVKPPLGGDLKARTHQFAVRVIRFYRTLRRTEEARVIGKQLLRSGTSIGANYRAACRARSKAEFVAKLGIVLEEADETVFWLELLPEVGLTTAELITPLTKEAHELVSIFVASLRTAKGQMTKVLLLHSDF
jgi:four helix bundle protein